MKKKILNVLLLLAIIFIAFRLRLIWINKPSGLWFDEIIFYLEATKAFPMGVIDAATKFDILMPLHQLCLHLWMKFFGESDSVIRMFSVVLGTMSVLGAYFAGSKLKDKKTGLIAASLFALNGCAIYFSQEVKFYIMTLMFGVFSIYFFLRLYDDTKDKIGWIGFIISNVLNCYTFTLSAFLMATEFLFILIKLIKEKTSQKIYWGCAIITTALLLPFLYLNIRIIQGINTSYAKPSMFLQFDISTLFYLLQGWITPYVINKVDNYTNYFNVFLSYYTLSEVIQIVSILSLSIFFIIWGIIKNEKGRKVAIFTLTYAIITAISISLQNYCLTFRYGVLFVPLIIILIALGISEVKIKWLRTTIITVLMFDLLCVNVFSTKAAPKTARVGLKPIADVMDEYNINKKDVVIFPFGINYTYLLGKYHKEIGLFIESPIIYNQTLAKAIGIKGDKTPREEYHDYLLSEKPLPAEVRLFNDNIRAKQHIGHTMMIVQGQTGEYVTDESIRRVALDKNLYDTVPFYFLPPNKFVAHMMDLSEKYFGEGKYVRAGNWNIFIYKIK